MTGGSVRGIAKGLFDREDSRGSSSRNIRAPSASSDTWIVGSTPRHPPA